jgi:elongation factor Ts
MIMSKVDMNTLQKLREITGLGMMDCKKALEESENNIEQAVDILRKKGALVAAKRFEKATSQGIIHAYIHPGSQIGVMVEINCETDFVANTDDVKQFAHDVCLHIAALKPLYLSPEEVDSKFLEHEKSILREQLADSGKPAKIVDQIIEGKVNKLYSDICLLNQIFVKNDQFTIDQMLKHIIAKTGG